MDCETCNDLLLDLHYDELDAAHAADVRAHLNACAECRVASERLGRTRVLAAKLAMPDAPAHSAPVMAALASTAPLPAAVSGRVSAVVPIERAREARSVGWLQRMGELAMRRQVAMVAISLLMVGLGLRYLPFRSPTQSVTTEMSPPEVIPATELAPVAPPAAVQPPAQNVASPMRARAQLGRAPNAAEGRVTSRIQGSDALRGATTGSGSDGIDNHQSARAAGAGSAADRRGPGEAETPVAAMPSPTPAAAPTAPSYNGLAQVPADEERQLQQAMPPAPAPAPTNWAAARSNAETASARGDLAATITSLQRSLALDPPASERQTIALALHRALVNAGRVEEANRVRAQYLTQAADTGALAGQVPASVPRTQTSAGSVRPSAPRPASTRPARRSNSNVNNDFNQSAY